MSLRPTYRSTVLPLLVATSVCVATASAFGALQSPFVVEIVQVVLFAVFIVIALQTKNAANPFQVRAERKNILVLFGIVALSAIVAFSVFLVFAATRGTVHTLFPVLFPCVTLLAGERLVAAYGGKIAQTIIGPGIRVLIVACVGTVFFAISMGLSLLFWRMNAFSASSYVKAIAALSCELFLQLSPFALYAITLRESFQLEADQPKPDEND